MAKQMSFELKIAFVIIVAFIAISVIMYNIPFEEEIATTTTTLDPNANTIANGMGSLVVAFKGGHPDLVGGSTATAVDLTITSIDVLLNGTYGYEWVSVLESDKSLNLLSYTDSLGKVAEKEIESGRYEQIRIGFSDSSIMLKNELIGFYTPKEYDLIVPDNTTFDHLTNLVEGSVLNLIIDYDISSSVTRTADGYIFDPVVTFSEQSGHLTNVVDA